MKNLKLSIARPQIPISILIMLSLIFIAIAKISAKDNTYKASSTYNKASVESFEKQMEVSKEVYVERSIKLYPIYN